jgi:hypothetical protein
MGYGVQRDAYDAACRALERTKGQLADVRLRIARLLTEVGPEGENEDGWSAHAVERVRELLADEPVPYDPHIRLVDVTAEARAAFGDDVVRELAEAVGGPLPIVSWRFEIDTPTGGKTTFNSQATADYVAAYVTALQQETRDN